MIRVHLKIHRSCRQSRGRDCESSETRAPNTLSASANEAFKIIVSCLNCVMIAQASIELLYLKNGLSAVMKLPVVMTPFLTLLVS